MLRKLLKGAIIWALEGSELPEIPKEKRKYTERTWRTTRLISLLSFFFAVAAIISSLYLMFTIWTANNLYVASGVKRELNNNFDTISAAAAVGRLDLVSMLLTFIGVVAAFSVIYGWTAFRSVAIEAAKAETIDRVPSELQRFMSQNGDSLLKNALKDAELLAEIQRGFTEVGIDDIDDAELIDDDSNWDEGNI